jgi:hypothetical protein
MKIAERAHEMPELKEHTYLGDAVYAAHDGFHIWLWTDDGIKKSRPIALEPSVLKALLRYRDLCEGLLSKEYVDRP